MASSPRTRTRAAAVTTTVLTPVPGDDDIIITVAPSQGGNAPVLPDDKLVMRQVKLGFSDGAKAKTFAGSGVQRIAYGVMVHHARLSIDIQGLPTLASCATSSEAKSAVMAHMRDHFIDDMQTTKDDGDQARADETQPRKDNGQLLRRGLELAAIMSANAVTYDMFNDKVGNFMVPSRSMIAKDKHGKDIGQPVGRLAKELFVLIDNRPLAMLGQDKKGNDRSVFFNASVAHYTACNGVAKKRPGGSERKKIVAIDWEKMKPEALAGEKGVSIALLANALRILLAPNNEPSELVPTDYEPDVWNFLNTAAILKDEAIENARKAEASKAA